MIIIRFISINISESALIVMLSTILLLVLEMVYIFIFVFYVYALIYPEDEARESPLELGNVNSKLEVLHDN